ncbi:MAG: PilC/PilY family type IV pilus protein, partial [bacterium]|nr:PilC/PilY family type IV pilus protein [bacterium]
RNLQSKIGLVAARGRAKNIVYDFEVKVTGSKIELWINGLEIGEVTRSDSFNGGYAGIDRKNWSNQGECGSNSMDGISPMWVSDDYIGEEPEVKVLGQTDVEIKRIKPIPEEDFIGRDVIEHIPARQILEGYVDGNNFETYVYSTYTLADLDDQVFDYILKIRNRGDESHTFDIQLNIPIGDIEKSWFIAYDYGSELVYNLPNSDNPYTGYVELDSGEEWEMRVFIMPSHRALFEGGLGKLVLDFEVNSRSDFSFDVARLVSNVVPKTNCCFWKWRLPITVSYEDTYQTGDLVDYQVLVSFSGISELKDARDDGADIIFTDYKGGIIPFWRKSFNKASGSGSFWVKIPKINSGTPGETTILMFWGNPDYAVGRSSIEQTFDLWEDWEGRNLNEIVGCPDGTTDCSGKPDDPEGWENIPTPDDNFNWWVIRNRLDGQAVMADKGGGFRSNDIGPFVVGGDVRWKSYEVLYSFYDEYNSYSSGYGNPQYNPVFHQCPGNTWGMEFFAKMFIFRPFAHGTDWTWTYQSYPGGILGEGFPVRSKRYWVKIKLFNNPQDERTYLRMLLANSSPDDIDEDADFTEVTENPGTGYIADPAFSLEGGAIGFGGWNGGFSYDNIRVRKYTSPEPTVTIKPVEWIGAEPITSLSFPILTPPLMNGRPVFIKGTLTPWKWFGNLFALYADCYLAGDCKGGENQDEIGTISLWDKIDDETPRGFGDHLMEETAGDNNSSGRKIYTAYNKKLLNFEVSGASTLRPLLGVDTVAEAEDLIRFARGKYIEGYSRSKVRDTDGSHDEDKQWKLGDVIHSNPLIVGIPNMAYSLSDYWDFVEEHRDRDLVAYFGSNEGMVHAVRLAKWEDDKYESDLEATELWAFIPNESLPELVDTTDIYHEYLVDGLFRAIDVEFDDEYKTILIGSMRTGGQSLFALDVTNPTAPELLWEINSTTNPDEFEKIGETFSSPALGKLRRYDSEADPWVAILGSGFNPYDIKNLSKPASLTVVNLKDGEILHQVSLSDKYANITTDMAVFRDQDGYIEKVYFGDHYGTLWRVDLSTTDKVGGFLNKDELDEDDMLFEPSDYTSSDIYNPPARPISAQPRVAVDEEKAAWVYFGSGSYGMYDYDYPYQRLYGLKDNKDTPYTEDDLINMTDSDETNPDKASWYIRLGETDPRDYDQETGAQSTKDRNERVLTTPEVYGGFVFFTTFTPSDNPCGGGLTRFYALGYKSGGYVSKLIKGVEDGGGEKEDVRSVVPGEPSSAKESVPSRPYIYVGQNEAGEPVAFGLVNLASGDLAKVELDTAKFSAETINILLWREIK